MKVGNQSINKTKEVGWFNKESGLTTFGYELVVLVKAAFKNAGGGSANGDDSFT